MTNARRLLVPATALAIVLHGSCVREYEVMIVNELSVPVLLELSQYHSEAFGGTPPRAFTTDLLLETRRVSLGAGEHMTAVFNDGAAGYWLRWRLLDPEPRRSDATTLDLIRDERKIRVTG